MHQRLHPCQPFSQLSPRMQICEIVFLESTALAQSNGQCIAQRQHGGGGGGRRQPQSTSFLRDRTIQRHIRRRRQRGNGSIVIPSEVKGPCVLRGRTDLISCHSD